MLEAVKVALDPTPAQARLLLMNAGAARVAFNACLDHVKACLGSGEKASWSFYSLRKWFNSAKGALCTGEDGRAWWPECSKEAFASGCEAAAAALKNWSDSRKGKRRGRSVGFPRFKAKGRTRPSWRVTTGSFGLVDNDPRAVRVPRVGRVHAFEDVARRVGTSQVKRMTLSFDGVRWHASLLVERAAPPKRASFRRGRVGVDLGLSRLATLSDGTVVENPRWLRRSLERLAKAQRKLSRCKKGSRRRALQRARVARIHARVAAQRADAIHKLTRMLAESYSEVVIEDLNVEGMGKNHALALSVKDASLSEVRRQLEYKCARSGSALVVADRWYPSTKACSRCGHVREIALSERVYECPECGLVMDRDLNASTNLENYPMNLAGSAPDSLNGRGGEISRTRSESRREYPAMRQPKAVDSTDSERRRETVA